MKHLCVIALIFIAGFNHAQVLPNASFENWTTETLWSDPIPYQSLNAASYMENEVASSFQTTTAHGGNFAAFMQAAGDPEFPSIGAISLGNPNFTDFQDPIPFTGHPDSLTFWASYSVAIGDQATVAVMLLKDGVQVGNTVYTLTGSTSGYVRHASEVTYLSDEEPNQLGFAAFSTNQNNPNLQSFLYLDDVSFVYNETTGDQIPGGDFENWAPVTITSLDEWSNSNLYTIPNESVSMSMNGYLGNCARITTQPFMNVFEENSIGFIVLQDIMSEECGAGQYQTGSVSIPTQVSGYYQYYAPKGETDSATVAFEYSKNMGDVCLFIHEHYFTLPPASEWTYFEVSLPFSAYSEWCFTDLTPDFFSLGFASTIINIDGETSSIPGGVLFIDELNLLTETCWSVEEFESDKISLYPNPACDALNIAMEKNDYTELHVLDRNGKVALNTVLTSSKNQLDISSLAAGTYTVRLIGTEDVLLKSFVKID